MNDQQTPNYTAPDGPLADAGQERAGALPAASSAEGADLGLGTLNRHWYRRCLDALEANLKKSGGSPSVEELKDLCDRIVTGFLTAVTAQAPDSDRLQFPADRAYFIPFHGDNAERFNFAKPFYQFLGEPTAEQKANGYQNSLWSFFPWDHIPDGVRIDSASVDKQDNFTIPFDRMIQVGELFTDDDEGNQVKKKETTGSLRIKKSLLLRGLQKDDRQQLRFGAEFNQRIRLKNAQAIEAIFEIYRATPGNAAVEYLVLNHLHIIQWLNQLQGRTADKAEVTLSQTEDDYERLFTMFLRWYFLKSIAEECDPQEVEKQDELLESLRKFVTDPSWEETPEGKQQLPLLLEALAKTEDTPFLKAIEYEEEESARQAGAEEREVQVTLDRNRLEPVLEQRITDELRKLSPYLRTFESDFLTPSREERLENELAQSLGDKLLRAGDTKQSFVWVCPDFADVDEGLYRQRRMKAARERVNSLSMPLSSPWVEFFVNCDRLYLKDMRGSLEAYWRTLAEVDRDKYVFASYDDPITKQGLPKQLPKIASQSSLDEAEERFWPTAQMQNPRPQNIFLRVKICDSLNEAIINGLFVFTTDHDEVAFKGKIPDVRNVEDINDVLAFAKVYFFIVRDYLHGLDRARDAKDIGRLNQYLYDERLRDLEKRMSERERKDEDFKRRGVIDKANWSKFVYELLNQYALSLVEKPKDVRIETFSYDRLLVIPLAVEKVAGSKEDSAAQAAGEKNFYDLPFYLFQSVYVERDQGQISGTHYSLVKPTQSPIERIDADAGIHRFRARSFQQVSSSKDSREKLEKILEKHYVGAIDYPSMMEGASKVATGATNLPVCSFVPKAIDPGKTVLSQDKPRDQGKQWAKSALAAFWNKIKEPESVEKLWNPFLTDLTATYRDLLMDDSVTLDSKSRQFFCLRLAILRTILTHIARECPTDPAALSIEREYHKILRLQFDDNQNLSVITLARQEQSKILFDGLEKLLKQQPDDLADFRFVDITLGKADEFVVAFLGTLTSYLVRGEGGTQNADASPTWFQPLLTRPLLEADKSMTPASAIGERLPIHCLPDERVKEIFPDLKADPKGSTVFLGTINLQLGTNEREMRRLSYLIAMVRDFDRTEWGTGLTKEEIQEDIENDISDLTLFTRTFFQNAYNFIAESVNRQQIRVLSTDINQIARNWYSNGIDDIVHSLQDGLRRLLQRSDGNLGRLRPEMMDCLFDSLLNVLVKEQSRPGDRQTIIELESFPFDRLVHVPLILGSADAPRLLYARTTIEKMDPKKEVGQAWAKTTSAEIYKSIRTQGRIWDATGGKKMITQLVDGETAIHLGQKPEPNKKSDARLTAADTALHKALAKLARDLPLRDAFIRSLYEGEALQSLALAGLIYHLLQRFHQSLDLKVPESKELADKFKGMAESLKPVIRDSVGILERTSEGTASVQTRVHMQRSIVLEPRSTFKSRSATGQAKLPMFRELFEALEGSDYEYGLGAADAPKESKVFFVYYSLAEPQTFTEVLDGTARYRGVFCFVLDDASTDVKSDEANAADQEDIRTFVHNCMGNFKQVLEQQALHHQLTQRGVEQLILGMLHRLKTDVVITSKVLGGIDEVLHKPADLGDADKRKLAFDKLLEKTAIGQSAMNGTQKLFKDLKRLSEFKNPPMQTFSSSWLAWFFVSKLAQAVAGAVAESNLSKENKDSAERDIGKIIEQMKTYLHEHASKGQDISRASAAPDEGRRRLELEAQNKTVVDRCQRHLLNLQKHLEAACAADLIPVELSLSYQIFSTEPIEFRGSYLLEEAMTILLENAFQAFAGFLQHVGKTKPAKPVSGRIGFVCRPSEIDGDVLLEITNSCTKVDEKMVTSLNADPPEPISARQHATGSGKKGGSGVGHYFAREVIRRYCGGQQVRRKLDVGFVQDRGNESVKVTVNLLRAVSRATQRVTTTQLLPVITAAVRVVSEDSLPLPANFVDAVPRDFPGDFEPADLFRVIWQLLDYDRQKLDEKLKSVASIPCTRIGLETNKLHAELVKALHDLEKSTTQTEDVRKQAREFRMELESKADYRDSSWFDLERILRAWQKSAVLKAIVNRKGLENLQGFANGEALDPMKFVPIDPDSFFSKEFRKLACFLVCDNPADLLKDLGVTDDGKPEPSAKRLAEAFRRPVWAFNRLPSDSGLLLAFRLYYGDPGKKAMSWLPTGKEAFTDEEKFVRDFNMEHLGRLFLQYRAALRRTSTLSQQPIGDLSLESTDPAPGTTANSAYRTVYLRLNVPVEGS